MSARDPRHALVAYLAQPGNNQSRLAAKSGLNASTICRILSGKGGCSLAAALRLDAATDGALRAETLCPPEEAALLARLRGAEPDAGPAAPGWGIP